MRSFGNECGMGTVSTRGIRLVVPLSLARKLSSCVRERTFRILVRTLFVLWLQVTKKLEYSIILCSSMSFDEHILLSLKTWLYRTLYFICGGCTEVQCRYGWVSVGFWYTSVLMSPMEIFITLVSRKFTELQEISCMNVISGTTPLRYAINAVRESLLPFQIRNISSMKRTQSII